MNHLFDYLTGTISKETQDFLDQNIFGEEIEKGETIKILDGVSYVKLEEGWEILEKAQKEGKVKEEKSREQIEKEISSKQPLEDNQKTIDEGHELIASDGTSGTVTSHDGKMVTVEYVKDGQKVETQVPAHVLEDRKKKGQIQHNANPKSLKELHTKLIEEMHIQGKDATAIISLLKNLGVNEDEAMEAISSYRRDRPVVEETKKKEVRKSIYEGGLQERQAELISSSFEKGKYTDKLQAMYKRKGLDENGNLIEQHCEDEVEKGEFISIEKSGHPVKFHEKHWNGKTWVYDYGQHSKSSVEKLEDSNYSSHEEEHQRKVADDITSTKEKITTHMKNHDSIHGEIKSHQQSIVSIVKVDGRDSKSTNPMKHQIHILNSRKEKELNIVKHLHSNLVTRLTR